MISMIMLALSASLAFVQPHEWTLAECIDYALENNLSVKQSSLNVERNEIAVNTARNSRRKTYPQESARSALDKLFLFMAA